ncbi:PEP-CTERM sorting domain-containing protein [Adhaeretor mobilis]|uniref:PEP-CTERM protein-sorting domain-containing protein n=1 Tax=Adhaeretor mobilis TaxID=1930276 RepID=A0A517MT57_9BACT|nr:PEP-CTERM sorting domain-containing protein [Adhaeretor mobilis]QDS98070.1 hypothetical protein HG15A2_13420 [Adhaeretor mobilis]
MKLHTLALSTLLTLALTSFGSTLSAAILTGSGGNLPIPVPNPAWPPGQAPLQVSFGPGFTGAWGAGVHPNWLGGFVANGPIPSAFNTGTIRYDFTTLPLGYLPSGTFMIFGDVDGGSTLAERFDLRAFDSANAPITTEWLGATTGPNTVHAITGTGTGTAGAIVPGNMPGWDWNGINPNTYRVAGSTFGGNPSVAVALVTNQPIYRLQLNKPFTHYGFGLQAPLVPEPSSILLTLTTGIGGVATRRRRSL